MENTVGYVKGHFWPGIGFVDLEDLNRQARGWCDTVANAKVHTTTRAVPWERLRIYHCEELIAEHPKRRSGAMVCDPRHFEGLPARCRLPELRSPTGLPLPSGPGIWVEQIAPAVEKSSLAFYEQLAGGR